MKSSDLCSSCLLPPLQLGNACDHGKLPQKDFSKALSPTKAPAWGAALDQRDFCKASLGTGEVGGIDLWPRTPTELGKAGGCDPHGTRNGLRRCCSSCVVPQNQHPSANVAAAWVDSSKAINAGSHLPALSYPPSFAWHIIHFLFFPNHT